MILAFSIIQGGISLTIKGDLLILLAVVLLLPSSWAKVGYDIDVTVNNSTAQSHFTRSQSTNVLSFRSDSNCRGDGNSSRYVNIAGFAGLGMKETLHTQEGRLISSNALRVASVVNWIYIDEEVDSQPYYAELNNSTAAIVHRADSYRVTINESMPTNLYDKSDLRYRGRGLSLRDSYVNNGDELSTYYQAGDFRKSSLFYGIYRNGLIIADVTPGQVSAYEGRNFSTTFRVTSESDRLSSFRLRSGKEEMEEIYIGSFKLSQKIYKEGKFDIDETDNGWLNCCPIWAQVPEEIGNSVRTMFSAR